MHAHRDKLFSIALSLALHAAAVLGLAHLSGISTLKIPAPKEPVMYLELAPAPRVAPRTTEPAPTQDSAAPPTPPASVAVARASQAPTPRPLASMPAPAAPSAEEWALAGTYTLKNSKRYRHNWGQQVRSLMGTAVEGPDQGQVRFRVEIAPDGTLERLDTLWSTSPMAEQLARAAMARMPALPPTPTGQPLVFERTITFNAFDAEEPPVYKYDCEPDPPVHGNRFTWDGQSPQVVADLPRRTAGDPIALEECLRQLPQDSVEAEAAHDQRQLEQWRSRVQGQ